MTASPIHTRRLALGLTQEQAARRAGIAQPSWARLERTDSDPKLSTLEVVAEALECTVAELLES